MSEPDRDLKYLVRSLSDAARTYDRSAAAAACSALAARVHESSTPFDARIAGQALTLLRNMRAFDMMQRLGDAFIRSGIDDSKVIRLYAQSIIESGGLVAAEALLEELANRETLGTTEGNEARGLLGRTRKQMYLTIENPEGAGAARVLARGTYCYNEVYQHDPTQIWHGVNAAALARRAARDGVDVGDVDAQAIAQAILHEVEDRELAGKAGVWDFGSAMEAAMVCDDGDEARHWLTRYVEGGADAFALASTARQLKEVWEVTPGSKWGDILAVLESHMMEAGGGHSIEVRDLPPHPEAMEQSSGGFEKTFGTVGGVSVRWWDLAHERLRSIARVEDEIGTGIGTAFLVKGSDLVPEWGDDLVAITNAHVTSSPPAMRGALEPTEALVNFTLLDDDPFEVTELLFQSSPLDLDVAVVRLAGVPEEAKPIPLAKVLPAVEAEPRLYVMGHPKGGDLKISIDDNILVDHDDIRVHYRAPTEPGSSGSPVFNRKWQLIALHHSGSDRTERLHGDGTYPANEGIALNAIKSAAQEHS